MKQLTGKYDDKVVYVLPTYDNAIVTLWTCIQLYQIGETVDVVGILFS